MKLLNNILEHMLVRKRYRLLSQASKYSSIIEKNTKLARKELDLVQYFASSVNNTRYKEIRECVKLAEYFTKIAESFSAKLEILNLEIAIVDKKLIALRTKST